MPHEPLDVEGSATWRTWFLAASPSFRLSRSTKDMSSTLTKTFRCLEKMLVADSGKKYPSTLTTGNFVKVSDAGWPLSMNHDTILMQNCTAITPGIDPFWKSSSKPLGWKLLEALDLEPLTKAFQNLRGNVCFEYIHSYHLTSVDVDRGTMPGIEGYSTRTCCSMAPCPFCVSFVFVWKLFLILNIFEMGGPCENSLF